MNHHFTNHKMHAFEYVYKNHFDEADWFLKADDDTFTIVDNLRFLLKDKNSSEPIFSGTSLSLLSLRYVSSCLYSKYTDKLGIF